MKVLILSLLIYGCSADFRPVDGDATPEQASVAILKPMVVSEIDPINDSTVDSIVYNPVCMGVAIGPSSIMTASHCVFATNVYFVDAHEWATTSSGKALATLGDVVGENVQARPEAPLSAWVGMAASADGPAELVRLRGTNFTTSSTILTGDHLGAPLQHGDSGSGVFQSGRLVGLVQTCDDVDTDGACDLTGGRFSPVP